jgi:DNA-binding transcriptional regulator YiaG
MSKEYQTNEKFKKIRQISRLSQSKMAKVLGVSISIVQKWDSHARHCPAQIIELLEFKLNKLLKKRGYFDV